MYKAPKIYPDITFWDRAVIELRGNPFPLIKPTQSANRNFIHNVLLDEAKKEYRRKKYAQLSVESQEMAAGKPDPIDEMAEQLEKTVLKEFEKNSSKNPEEKQKIDVY